MNHHRSGDRSGVSGQVADLLLDEPPLFTARGKFSVEPLEASLLFFQLLGERLEPLQGSMLDFLLEFFLPSRPGPLQRQGCRSSLLAELRREGLLGGEKSLRVYPQGIRQPS